jgi:hypothetical protein
MSNGTRSESLVDALDGVRDAVLSIGGDGVIEYPLIAFPSEHVLAFNNNEFSFLKGIAEGQPYFTSNGEITDLHHHLLPGSKVQSTFPVDLDKFLSVFTWPNKQPEPFNLPTGHSVDTTNAVPAASSKQAYFFGDGSYLVTVGPSIPKIAPTKDGGAQFWVSSIGVISQGVGKYEGAKGMSVYTGSAYLKDFPLDDQAGQISFLQEGFSILVGTYFKLVLKEDQG